MLAIDGGVQALVAINLVCVLLVPEPSCHFTPARFLELIPARMRMEQAN